MKRLLMHAVIILSVHAGYAAHITVKLQTLGTNDSSILLKLYDSNVLPVAIDSMAPATLYSAKLINGSYQFDLKIGDKPVYFNLYRNSEPKALLSSYLIEETDDLSIEIMPDNHKIKGIGSFKNNCIDSLEKNFIQLRDSSATAWSEPIPAGIYKDNDRLYLKKLKALFSSFAIIRDKQLSTLQGYKSGMDPLAYQVIKADIIGRLQSAIVSQSNFYLINGNIHRNVQNLDSITKFIGLYQYDINDIPGRTLALSREYVNYIYMHTQLELLLENRKYTFWEKITKNYSGLLRDKLLSMRLYDIVKYESNMDSIVSNLAPYITSNFFSRKINDLVRETRPGNMAFDFSLPDKDGHMVSLHDFKGKLIFLDFWYTGCGPCLFYYQQCLKEVENHYSGDNSIVFISIAVDKDKQKWAKSLVEHKYTSGKATNLFTEGLGWDHAVIRNYSIKGYPSPLLIGQDGKIITRNVVELGGGRSPVPEKLIETIDHYKKGPIH